MTFIQKIKNFFKVGDISKMNQEGECTPSEIGVTECLPAGQIQKKALERKQCDDIRQIDQLNEKIKNEEETFFCKICGKKFETEFELNFHYRTQPEIHVAYDDKWDLAVGGETKEEKLFRRQQQDAINKLREQIPDSKECCICGKMDFPPFEGRDGNYYCRDHILPENR